MWPHNDIYYFFLSPRPRPPPMDTAPLSSFVRLLHHHRPTLRVVCLLHRPLAPALQTLPLSRCPAANSATRALLHLKHAPSRLLYEIVVVLEAWGIDLLRVPYPEEKLTGSML